MSFVGTSPRIDCNVDGLPDELRSLCGSVTFVPSVFRILGKRFKREISRNAIGTIALSKTDRHHSGRGSFHEGPVGRYGSNENRERHIDLEGDIVREAVVAYVDRVA
jgi:hypothetical protein